MPGGGGAQVELLAIKPVKEMYTVGEGEPPPDKLRKKKSKKEEED